jgi:hypothetical protein
LALLENSEQGGADGMGHWYRSCQMFRPTGFVLRPGDRDQQRWRTAERLSCLLRTLTSAGD